MAHRNRKKHRSLASLDGKPLGRFSTVLDLNPFPHRQGWTRFSIFIEQVKRNGSSAKKRTQRNERSDAQLILEGVHSKGGRGVTGWIEVGDYYPLITFENGRAMKGTIDLAREGLDRNLFQMLGEIVPPGGHFMFAYEVFYDSQFHDETLRSLSKRIPPICTAQGELLFHAGCRFIKNWYLAEGGHEGPRKLWGEKPLNRKEMKRMDERTFFALQDYLSREPNPDIVPLESFARKRAIRVLGDLQLKKELSALRRKIIRSFHSQFPGSGYAGR